MKYNVNIQIKRENPEQFCNRVFKKAVEMGCFTEVDPILEYNSARCYGGDVDIEISDYQFDFQAVVKFGSCEGIYVDCYISGIFQEDQEEPKRIHCGTIKTLETSLDVMQKMGKLCGSLVFCANEVIKDNIDLYSPKEEIEEREQRKKERKQQSRR